MTPSLASYVSPLDRRIEVDGDVMPLWQIELQNLNRGFCSSLLFALPLLYTFEMWVKARTLPDWVLLIWMAFGLAVCAGYFQFSGFRKERFNRSAWLDAVTAMGIGIVASAVTLILIGRYTFDGSPTVIFQMIALQAVPTAIGASVAISQIGGRGAESRANPADDMNPDLRSLLATALGALLFAFNIAPTVETALITADVSWWHLVALAGFSLFVSWLLVFQTRAQGVGDDDGRVLNGTVLPTIFSYFIALAASYVMLYLFGYLEPSMPFAMQVAFTVVIGYAATLGGAAGRVIL